MSFTINRLASTIPTKKHLIVGIGNLLRQDDGVGVYLMRRLRDHFGDTLQYLEVYAPDILMAETFSQMDHVLIIDAMEMTEQVPYKLIPIEPADNIVPSVGFVTHVVDWSTILGMAREFFDHAPEMNLLAIKATHFDFSETLSQDCTANADKAFEFLVRFCARHFCES